MNKHLVATLTLVAVLGGSVSPAFADNDSGIRGFVQKFRQEKDKDKENSKLTDRDVLRASAASKSQELRLKLEKKRDAQRQERLMKFWSKSGERLEHLLNREVKMSAKIAERLARFKAAGKDVSKQEALLVTANTAIAKARASLTSAIATMKAMTTEGKPVNEIVAKARELHKNVLSDIRAAHKALVDVIVATRGMSVMTTPSPSPSVSVSATPTPTSTP
jgi:hypothetical protein